MEKQKVVRIRTYYRKHASERRGKKKGPIKKKKIDLVVTLDNTERSTSHTSEDQQDITTVTEKKLLGSAAKIMSSIEDDGRNEVHLTGYRFMDIEVLVDLINTVGSCPKCGCRMDLSEIKKNRDFLSKWKYLVRKMIVNLSICFGLQRKQKVESLI